MIIINAIKCLMCGDTLYSRSGHDFRTCYCGNLSVDGGPFYHDDTGMTGGEKYGRRCVYIMDKIEVNDAYIDLTAIDFDNIGKILLDDWNYNRNEYGLIRDYSYNDDQRDSAKAKIELLK